jgi:hypothetical protein
MGRHWHHPALRIHTHGQNYGKTDEQNWPDHGIHLKTIPSGSSHLERCAWNGEGFKPGTLTRLAELLPCRGMCYNRRAVMVGIARLFAAVGIAAVQIDRLDLRLLHVLHGLLLISLTAPARVAAGAPFQ